MQDPIEDDHRFVWVRFEKLRGNMYLEMQNWALEEANRLFRQHQSVRLCAAG